MTRAQKNTAARLRWAERASAGFGYALSVATADGGTRCIHMHAPPPGDTVVRKIREYLLRNVAGVAS